MKIGVYIEHGVGNGVGGAELAMAHLAGVWSRAHDVDLIHHRPPLTRERIQSFSQEDYSRVTSRCLAREPEPARPQNPLARYRLARDWHRSLSAGYDLFVNCTHWLPPFCHAKRGVLLVLFPYYQLPRDLPEIQQLPRWKQLRHLAYHDVEWRRRLATYRRAIAISEFARTWTRRRWRLDPAVVYPPIDVDFTDRPKQPKQPLIVSVNRFNLRAHKKQLELMQVFAGMKQAGGFGAWHYASIGGLNATPDNRAYFDHVAEAGAGCGGFVEANVPPGRLKELLTSARVYWHAMGLGEDTEQSGCPAPAASRAPAAPAT